MRLFKNVCKMKLWLHIINRYTNFIRKILLRLNRRYCPSSFCYFQNIKKNGKHGIMCFLFWKFHFERGPYLQIDQREVEVFKVAYYVTLREVDNSISKRGEILKLLVTHIFPLQILNRHPPFLLSIQKIWDYIPILWLRYRNYRSYKEGTYL